MQLEYSFCKNCTAATVADTYIAQGTKPPCKAKIPIWTVYLPIVGESYALSLKETAMPLYWLCLYVKVLSHTLQWQTQYHHKCKMGVVIELTHL